MVLQISRSTIARIVFFHRFKWDLVCSFLRKNTQDGCLQCPGCKNGRLSFRRTAPPRHAPLRPALRWPAWPRLAPLGPAWPRGHAAPRFRPWHVRVLESTCKRFNNGTTATLRSGLLNERGLHFVVFIKYFSMPVIFGDAADNRFGRFCESTNDVNFM